MPNDLDDIVQRNHWTPDPEALEADRFTQWRTCPVTIGAAAMLSDGELTSLSRWLTPESRFMDKVEARRPDADDPRSRLWKGIGRIVFHAWADSRFIAMVDFGEPPANDPEGFHIRYADSTMVMGSGNPDDRSSVLPETLLLAAAGAPMTGLLPHPIFDGLTWSENQDKRELNPPPGLAARPSALKGPPVDIDLGPMPGVHLASLARARRPGLVDALIRLTPGAD